MSSFKFSQLANKVVPTSELVLEVSLKPINYILLKLQIFIQFTKFELKNV